METALIGIAAAALVGITVGLGIGYRNGKITGMKMGIEAREFAKSFGVGRDEVQTAEGYCLPRGLKKVSVKPTTKDDLDFQVKQWEIQKEIIKRESQLDEEMKRLQHEYVKALWEKKGTV